MRALIRRDVFLQLGGYYQKGNCRYSEDSVIALLARWYGPFIRDKRLVHFFSMHADGLTQQSKSTVVARPMAVDLAYVIDKLSAGLHGAARRLSAYLAAIDAVRLLRSMQVGRAWQLLKISVGNNQLSKQNTFLYYLRFVLLLPFVLLNNLFR